VITEPNGKYKHHFKLDYPEPISLAVEAFNGRKPIIIHDTLRSSFRFFEESQKEDIRSVFACPLFYSTDPTIGLLFAEASTPDYFRSLSGLPELLSSLGSQIALRMKFEHQMQKILKNSDTMGKATP